MGEIRFSVSTPLKWAELRIIIFGGLCSNLSMVWQDFLGSGQKMDKITRAEQLLIKFNDFMSLEYQLNKKSH